MPSMSPWLAGKSAARRVTTPLRRWCPLLPCTAAPPRIRRTAQQSRRLPRQRHAASAQRAARARRASRARPLDTKQLCHLCAAQRAAQRRNRRAASRNRRRRCQSSAHGRRRARSEANGAAARRRNSRGSVPSSPSERRTPPAGKDGVTHLANGERRVRRKRRKGAASLGTGARVQKRTVGSCSRRGKTPSTPYYFSARPQ